MDHYVASAIREVTAPKPITGLTELNMKLVDIVFESVEPYIVTNDWILFDSLMPEGEPLDWYLEQYRLFFDEYYEHVLVKAITLFPAVKYDEADLEVHKWKLFRRIRSILTGQELYRGRLDDLQYGQEPKKAVFLKFISSMDTNNNLRFSSVVKAAVPDKNGDLIDAGEIERILP